MPVKTKPDPVAQLAREIAELEKKIGKGMIHPASTQPPVYHLPFMSPHMNYATEGGAPWNRVTAMSGQESTGKAVALDTPIPTPLGWTTMGQVEVGDYIFDDQGLPTRVTYTSSVFVDHDCYLVEFDDGTSIIADAEHRWMTSTMMSRQAHSAARSRMVVGHASQRLWQSPQQLRSVVTTAEIAESVLWGKQGHFNHAIDNHDGLRLPEASLTIDPYTLGVWLGDGTKGAGEYTKPDEELAWHIRAAGYEVREHPRPDRCTKWHVMGLVGQLRSIGVLRDKHIPSEYLRASYDQRLELLRGLMDTDGSCEMTGRCEFSGTCKALFDGVYELISSLGFKARVTEGVAKLNGVIMGLKWRIGFTPSQRVFHLPRKADRQRSALSRQNGAMTWRKIVSCDHVESVPTRCLQVEADSHLFLIGEQMVVTHNTLCALELVAQAQNLPESAETVLWPRIQYHRTLGDFVTLPGGEKLYTAARLEDELEWIRENFPDGARCLWHDIEGQFDKKRAQAIGIDTDALYMTELTVIEDFGYALPFGYRNYHLQVMDSTSAASSQLKLKQEPGKSAGYGIDARQWKDIMRSSMTYFGPGKNDSGIPNMVVMIHQMSTNMRTGGSQAVSTKFLRHTSSCSIEFTRGQFLWEKDGVLTDGKTEGADDSSMAGMAEPDGLEVFVKISKSRTCRPFRVGAMHFDYKTLRYPLEAELASSGLYYGIFRQKGSWFYVVDENGEEQNIGQGLKTVYARLVEDEVLRERIMCRLLSYEDE